MKNILRKTPFVKVFCFLVIFAILVSATTGVLLYRDRKTDNSSYQIINFYKEQKDSADVVFIGSSCCFAYYSPLFAYHSYGVRTTNFSSSGMGMIAYKYAIEEVRKSQNKAKLVLTVTPLDEMSYSTLHYLADYMPWSKNKLDLLKAYFTRGDESILNSIEYFFPLMRFHERWSEIDADSLILDNGTKGATQHIYYLSYANDISKDFYTTDKRTDMPENWKELFTDLLDYCDKKNEDLLFLIPPRTYKEGEFEQLNSLVDLIESRGYEVMDLREKADEIGLNLTYDYYDIRHTNVHGSLKYTDYVIRTLMKKYSNIVPDNKDEGFEKAYEKYRSLLNPYVVEEELDVKHRDYHLERPELVSLTDKEESVALTWKKVDGADGYVVYRSNGEDWQPIGESNEDCFFDNEPVAGKNKYTVISYTLDENGERKYGNYDYKGLSIIVDE